ncbi:FemAB family XrtA/PEP-CTERM system-associated protein [Photobacterium alginatilyticum]|uniref:FemAB family PEP-CTERM system-associated protein n=1 Tax=Photobacterium alginatilyticum TaxID=1775171 RepID=A0ABW9YFY5_9GAMM|nr:FemAB family XrtA/PEP-CTERM system-associated protein [Photobacterium alginatilyticum]NBI52496.1 FemAB family PEP-CTERM system-associated protein [Photobacterium alginatilyticum]
MMQELAIRKLSRNDYPYWDSYVDNHPEGSFFHLSGWLDVIDSVFGHQHHYMLAESGNRLVGVLPLFEQKSWLFGHTLVSTPFCVYGGALADSSLIRKKLEAAAFELGCELNVDYVELRDKLDVESEAPWVKHCHHSRFSLALPEESDDIIGAIKKKRRNVIRHSLRNNLSWDTSDNLKSCYDVYAESVRDLGTPVFTHKLFTKLKETFPDRCETMLVHDKDQQPISTMLSFYYKDHAMPYYGGGKYESKALNGSDYMIFQLMHVARQRGATLFDYGRSKNDSGAYQYKKHWGMEAHPLNYKVALVKAKSLPNLSPNNPKYKYFIKAWKRLPLPVSRLIGPMLSKYLG